MAEFEQIMTEIEQNAGKMRAGGGNGFENGGFESGGFKGGSGAVAADIARLHTLRAEIDSLMSTLARTKDCAPDAPITSHRFLKRIIRKMTLWLIEPAWQKQRVYNNAILKTLERLNEITGEIIASLHTRPPRGDGQ